MADFPLNPPDRVVPTNPAEEPTREEIAAHPENLEQRVQRTRRYFRLTRLSTERRYARGLDSAPGDFA